MKKTAVYQTKRPGAARWFNRWVQSPRWFYGFWIAVGVCLVIYVLNALLGRVHPASTWGLSYGIAAALLFVAVFAYAIRRRTMRLRPGRTWHYLQLHVYGGALFLLLMLMHTGFGMPQGALTTWLWALSLWVVGSGLVGIVIQKWIPMLLNSGLSVEVHYDRIPTLVDEVRQRAETLAEAGDPTVARFYERTLAPTLEHLQPRLLYFFDITAGIQARTEQFEYFRPLLPPEEQRRLDDLHDLYKTKLEIDAHYTLQKALRWWLYLHVPVSLVMIVLLVLHVFTVLYY